MRLTAGVYELYTGFSLRAYTPPPKITWKPTYLFLKGQKPTRDTIKVSLGESCALSPT